MRYQRITLSYSHEVETPGDFTCYDFHIQCRLTSGDKGCWRTANGDGWPPSGPECEIISAVCTGVYFTDHPNGEIGSDYTLTPAEGRSIGQWFMECIASDDRLRESIEEQCATEAAEREADDHEAACEARYEALRCP